MRLSLIGHAEIAAKLFVKDFGTEAEFIDVVEFSNEFLDKQMLLAPPVGDELNEFIEYVDYLISKAEVEVNLPKTRL